MKITEKDLYDGNTLRICQFTIQNRKRWCVYVKPINGWIPITTLVNGMLKQKDQQ